MDTSERIAWIFQEVMAIEIPSGDTDIIAAGMLDSLALVTLLVEIEQQLDVAIPLEAKRTGLNTFQLETSSGK